RNPTWLGVSRFQLQGGGVHTVALTGWQRTVRKHVAEVGVTSAAGDFRPAHQPAIVRMQSHVVRGDRLPEARPTGARIEFRLGIKQGLTTTDAMVNAVFLRVPISAAEGSFGPVASCDAELLGRQQV